LRRPTARSAFTALALPVNEPGEANFYGPALAIRRLAFDWMSVKREVLIVRLSRARISVRRLGQEWRRCSYSACAPPNDISPTSNPKHKEMTMPLINVKLIEGVFNETQKRKMVSDLTDAMVAIEGEPMRQVTWVVIEEVKSGNWALGGKPLTTADVKALQARRSAA
jgi:4-oxalocrotonate tautomerase